MRRFISCISLLTLAFFLCTLAHAQDAASLTGVVTDSSGAVIPGAVVTLTNPSTGVSYAQKTDNTGTYRFANVPANSGYKLTISGAGFSSMVVSDMTLNVGTTRTQNGSLTPGKTVETVQVSAGNAEVTLNTTDNSIGNNISIDELQNLPVYDRTRGIGTLFMQQAGVDSFQGSVTGARVDQSEVTLDGMDAADFATGQTFYMTNPAPVDSVQQFTGTVAGLTSSVGTGSGGQFQLVTKNGTNQFHGNLNEYHRDTTTVANTWFNNLNGLPRTPLIRNQFGGSIGGPIKRDKLFFFFDLADSRIVQSSSAERLVPLDAFRAGTLNYINNTAGCNSQSRINTQQGCISTLTSQQVQSHDPSGIGFNTGVLSFINSRYPHANDLSRGDGVNTGGYRFTTPTPDNNITYVGRVDYNLTPTQKVYGRFTINRRDAVYTGELPEFPTDPLTHPIYDRSYGYVVSHVWQIGANKVNEFYYGDTISKLSFPDLYNPTGANQYSFTGLDGPYTDYDGQKRRIPVPEVRDDFNWQHGSHSLTFGGTFKFIKTNSNLVNDFNFVQGGLTGPALSGGLTDNNNPFPIRPSDIYNGSGAKLDYDTMYATALGLVGQIYTNYSYTNKGAALAAGSGTPRAYRFYQTEAYFGDTWKVNRKLTLSYGVRYQLYSVPYEVHGAESVPTQIPLDTFIKDRISQQNSGDTSNNGLPFYTYVLGGKANHGPRLYDPSYKDFAPRFGFAFTPTADGKTVINGGAGIIYDRTVINAINFLQDQISYLFYNTQYANFGASGGPVASVAAVPRLGSNLSYDPSLNPAPVAATVPYTPYVDETGTPFGLADGQTNFVIPKNLKDPYSIALNLGIQQELPAHTILKFSYVGRLGRRLLADADANQVIDVPDYTHGSTQSMSQAFAGLTTQMRANPNASTFTPQPWFENVMAAWGPALGYASNTDFIASYFGNYAYRGDISDALYGLSYFTYNYGLTGLLPTNIGIPSQFGSNTYLTNMGNSNYNGLLLTVDKNMSNGLSAAFNYTWSHSIDNASLGANSNALFTASGMICDILHPRACRGSSDFDVRQVISSNFVYSLPFGHGQQFAANSSRLVDELIGGWSVSGLPAYRTGLAVFASSHAYLASFDNLAPAIFTGSKASVQTHVNVNHATKTVYGFAGGAAGAAKVFSEFRGPIGIEYGQRNILRGPGAFNFDAGLQKNFPIVEDRVNMIFRADAFNVFNHPNFGTPNVDIVDNESNFGQITGTQGTPSTSGVPLDAQRVAQFSLRLEF